MSGEERAANLEKLANARRLRVTAIIPPQYNPINRGWNHPAVPRHFILLHPSSPCSSPFVPTPIRAIATSTRCSFQRSFPAEPFVSPSFRRCTAAYNEWRTSSKALRFYSFLSSLLSFPVPLPSYTSLIFRLYFFPRHPSSCRARWFDLLSFSAPLFPTRRPSLHHENKWGAHVKAKKKKKRRLSCVVSLSVLGCRVFSTIPSFHDVDIFAGGFALRSLHGFPMSSRRDGSSTGRD